MARTTGGWTKLALVPLERRGEPRGGTDDHAMRVDGDWICPRCFGWVTPQDIVRRTAYGPVEHETCPATAPVDIGA